MSVSSAETKHGVNCKNPGSTCTAPPVRAVAPVIQQLPILHVHGKPRRRQVFERNQLHVCIVPQHIIDDLITVFVSHVLMGGTETMGLQLSRAVVAQVAVESNV